MSPDYVDALFEAARAYVARYYLAGAMLEEVRLCLANGKTIKLPIPPPVPPNATNEPFVPTPFQQDILEALEGKALRTDALANKVGDRSRLFREPGGLKELQRAGLVAHHQRLGYYRPDTPPPELSA